MFGKIILVLYSAFEIKLKGHLDINYSWPTYKFHNYEAMKPIIYTIL